jgi:hypothetical protein
MTRSAARRSLRATASIPTALSRSTSAARSSYGTLIFIGDTLLNGRSRKSHVDVLAAYNTARDPDLSNAVTWTPLLVGEFHPTQAVAGVVRNTAGTFREE